MKPRIHWAWVILAASFFTVFATYSIRLSYGILMPEMIGSLHISKARAGAIASSFYAAYTVFTPLVGFLADRISARKLIAFFCVLQGIGTLLMGFPTSLGQACLFFGLVGVGSSAMWTPIVTLVQRWFGVRRRGTVLGILSISYAIGYGIMGILLPFLVREHGWRSCWILLSVLAFLLVPLNALLLRTRPEDMKLTPWGNDRVHPASQPPRTLPARLAYRDLLKLRNLWMGGLAYFFTAFTAYVVNLFIVTYANLELGLPFAHAASLASFIAFSGIPGALAIPMLSDSLGRKKCLVLINLSYSAVILLLVGAGNRGSALAAAACLYGVVYAATWPVYAAAGADFFPPGTTGSVLGFWTIFFGVGLILAPALGGYLADATGSFAWSFLMAAGTGLLAALCIGGIRKMGFSPAA